MVLNIYNKAIVYEQKSLDCFNQYNKHISQVIEENKYLRKICENELNLSNNNNLEKSLINRNSNGQEIDDFGILNSIKSNGRMRHQRQYTEINFTNNLDITIKNTSNNNKSNLLDSEISSVINTDSPFLKSKNKNELKFIKESNSSRQLFYTTKKES